MRLLLWLLFLSVLTLSLVLVSGCSTTPVQPPPHLRAKPTTCFLSLPPTLELLPPGFESYSFDDKATALLDLHQHDGTAYAQALTQLHDCQDWIRETP